MQFPINTGELIQIGTEVGARAKSRGYDLRALVYLKETRQPDGAFVQVAEIRGDGAYSVPPAKASRECFINGLIYTRGRAKLMEALPPQSGQSPFIQRYAADTEHDFSDYVIRAVSVPQDELDASVSADTEKLLSAELTGETSPSNSK